MTSKYMDTFGLEEYSGLPRQYWARLRCKNSGPQWIKVSRRKVLYSREAVDSWLLQHSHAPQAAPEDDAGRRPPNVTLTLDTRGFVRPAGVR